jgi:Peptidase of plants and bacteria
MTTRSRCDICRVPLNDQGKTIREQGGNIYRCASCYRTAVTSTVEAQKLYQKTHALLKRELKLDIPLLPALHIVERAKLTALHRQNSTSGPAETSLEEEPQHLLGFFRRVGEDQNIYIEQVLPSTLFQAVAAHELAHAWQSINAPSQQPPNIVEGFAEWVAYSILLALDHQAEAERLTHRNDLYGVGLQFFIKLEREHGRNGVLQRAVQ